MLTTLYGDAESGHRFPKICKVCFKQSLRKKKLFLINPTCLYGKIVIFSYLWTENVSQLFIRKQIEIAQQSVYDWTSFYREVMFDGMIFSSIKNRYSILVSIIFTRFNCTLFFLLL